MRLNIQKAKGHKVEENQKTWKSFPRFQKILPPRLVLWDIARQNKALHKIVSNSS